MSWKLSRTIQCPKCPWRKDAKPREIPNGYCEVKHENLANTIAEPEGESEQVVKQLANKEFNAFACHETGVKGGKHEYCIGWVKNQLQHNNIILRIKFLDCENVTEMRTIGEQHKCFEDTLPKD